MRIYIVPSDAPCESPLSEEHSRMVFAHCWRLTAHALAASISPVAYTSVRA